MEKVEDKYRYHIYPDRTYVLTYDETVLELTGEEIINRFYREAMWEVWFRDIND